MSLNARQLKFIDEYLIDLNATQAAIRAGYSPKTAGPGAAQVLKNIKVAAEIERRQTALAVKSGVTVEWLIERYRRLASGDVRNLYREDGSMKLPHELDDDTAYSIAGIDIEESAIASEDGETTIMRRTKKMKRWDPAKALDSLGRHLGMFGDKDRGINVNITLEALVAASLKA